MKKGFTYYSILFIILFFASCSKNEDYTILIPTDADFVALINPKSIAEKGNFQKLEQYKIYELAESEIKNQDPALDKLLNEIKNNPTSAGIDIISPIYVFGQKINGKNMVALITNMRDKDQFEEHLATIYKGLYQKEDISFDKKDGFTTISGFNKPFMAWNKSQFLVIVSEFGVEEKTIQDYFTKIITDKHSLAKENNSFGDFVKNSQDINVWYTGNFLKNFSKKENNTKENLDFTKSSWVNFISFTSDGISFTQKFHPDAITKVELEKRPMWKSRINTDFFKYFPARSYLNIGLGIYPTNTRYIFEDQNFLTNFLEQYNVDLSKLEQSFEGEALFSIYDFEIGKAFNPNDFFGKKDAFIKQVVYPQFVLGGKMKNDIFFNEFLASHQENIQKVGPYYMLPISTNMKIYLTYKNNLMYITNNQSIMNQYLNNVVSSSNFVTSQYATNASNPMFGYVNLNFEQYPKEVQQYIYQQIPFGNTKEIQTILSNFDHIDYRVSNEYTKTGKIHMKKADKNSLEVIFLLLDEAYSLFFNQTQQQNAN
ncbi:DUF4836 family protein [Empedobacter brevis]|uniref:DUF4836 family protein n=1 Tax=Empedobacter brevis TaxID=247 RepID=UPI00123D492E|nr:DUF4836 family protein [Empedobacter brevis]QES92714.1 DUF4836 family protein [Empedobacter brevis]